MVTVYQKIRNAIEGALDAGKGNFIIYPYGEYGILTKQILNDSFGIAESYIVDNKLARFNSKIKSLDFCKDLEKERYTVLFTCANPDVYEEVLRNVKVCFSDEAIVDIFRNKKEEVEKKRYTKCGKYSSGPLCNHYLVESFGAFSGAAEGADVVENHPLNQISPHLCFYYGGIGDDKTIHPYEYQHYKNEPWYFDGVVPKGKATKLKRTKIGNDVWIGRDVLITNGSNIGNGVIVGAGAIITKDVPDYAVVAGVPAKIIRYRYSEEQIRELNRIAWWDWSDEKIRACWDDFYLDIQEFINKHKNDDIVMETTCKNAEN